MNSIEDALTYLFNLIYTDIVNPIRRSMINSTLINNLNTTINRFLNSFFNIFREVPTSDIVYLNNNSEAEIIGVFIAFLSFKLFYKIIVFGFSTCGSIMNSMLISDNSREWRSQWKRRKDKK